jgi:hypothetical protein
VTESALAASQSLEEVLREIPMAEILNLVSAIALTTLLLQNGRPASE